MKNRTKLKMGTLALTLAVVFSSMLFAIPVYAVRADEIPMGTPVIDGVMEDLWNGASNKIAIEMSNEGDEAKNATGYARMMWDSGYLYVLGYVNDKTLSTYEQTDSTWWASDSFEIFLDERNAHNTVKNEITQIRVSRQGTLSGMLMSTAVNRDGVLAEYGGTKWAAKNVNSNGTYVVEMAIPWTRISSPSAGTQIGTEFQINDVYDGASKTKADGVINSEVIDTWQCMTYRMMTLSAAKADSSNTSNPNGGTTTPNGGTTTPNGGTTTPNGGTTIPNGEDANPNGEDANPNDADKADSPANKKPASANKTKDPADEETSDSILRTAIIAVAVVVALVIAGCVAAIIISKKRAGNKHNL